MKYFVFILSMCLLIYYGQLSKQHKSLEGYGYAAQWGCYKGTLKACEYAGKAKRKLNCYMDLKGFCAKSGDNFRKFMEQGKQ